MLAPARAALLKAKYLKDEAWEAARLRYIAQDPPPNSGMTPLNEHIEVIF